MVNLGSDMTGGIMSAILTKQQNEKQREWSSAEAAAQRDWQADQNRIAMDYNTKERLGSQEWNKEMWNLNNEYNSPDQQMQRMMSAGINPNNAAMAIAGSSVSASPASTSPASINPASGASAAMPPQYNEVEAFGSMLNATANYKAQLAQAKLSDAMASKTEEETKGLIIDNHFKPFEKSTDIEQAKQKIALMVKEGELTDAQATQILELLPFTEGRELAQIEELFASASQKAAEVEKIEKDIQYYDALIETEQHKRKQLDAAAYEAYMAGEASHSVTLLNGKQGDLTDVKIELEKLHRDEQHLKNDWRKHCQSLGYDPDSHHVDRLIDGAGSNIRLFEEKISSIWDNTKAKLSSLKFKIPKVELSKITRDKVPNESWH